MNVGLGPRVALSVGTILLALAVVAPATSAATAPRPVITSTSVSPKTLPATGGLVRVVVRDKFATTCRVMVTPRIKGFPRTFHCAAGHFATAVRIAKNTKATGQTIRFKVSATGPGGHSNTRVGLVSQATDTGPIGATLNVHDSSGNALAVTVTQVVDPATGVDQFNQPNPGDRFVAVEMTLSNQSAATISDDANGDTTVIGTDSQVYTADFDNVSECTNFGYGEFTLLAGSPSELGCVVFQLPNGVNVKQVQFSFDSAFLDTAQWNA